MRSAAGHRGRHGWAVVTVPGTIGRHWATLPASGGASLGSGTVRTGAASRTEPELRTGSAWSVVWWMLEMKAC